MIGSYSLERQNIIKKAREEAIELYREQYLHISNSQEQKTESYLSRHYDKIGRGSTEHRDV